MCDYSLHYVKSRPAKVGDQLITTKFAESITHGFSPIGEPNLAVCLVPGTEIAFEKEVEYRHPFARLFPKFRFGKLGCNIARFRQINLEIPNTHHDALEFANGKVVLLTQLCHGQHATVLQLPAQPHTAKESTEQKHLVAIS
jgi:hypothetical protein